MFGASTSKFKPTLPTANNNSSLRHLVGANSPCPIVNPNSLYPSHTAVHYNGINLVYTVSVQQLTETHCSAHFMQQFIIKASPCSTLFMSSSNSNPNDLPHAAIHQEGTTLLYIVCVQEQLKLIVPNSNNSSSRRQQVSAHRPCLPANSDPLYPPHTVVHHEGARPDLQQDSQK